MEGMVDIATLLFTLVLVGFLTEAVVEILKDYFFKTKKSKKHLALVSLVTSTLLCFSFKVSLFEPDSISSYYIGMVVCAIVASRGSNYVHDFVGKIPTKPK